METKIQTALEVYKDISRQIEFADRKAWILIGLNLLIALVLTVIGKPITILASVLNLLLAGLILASVITPRITDGCNKECMFWAYDIRCGNFDEDLERFKENLNDPEKVFDCISRSVVAVSDILKKKYEKIRLYSFLSRLLIALEAFFIILLFIQKN